MIDYSRRNFLKLSLGSAIAVSMPLTLTVTGSKLITEEVIEHSYSFGQKALAYSFTTQELMTSYLAFGGIWIVDLLSALLIFMTLICSVILAAIAI